MSVTTQRRGRPAFDEAYEDDGEPREHYERLLAALERADLLALRDAAQRHEGASFGPAPFLPEEPLLASGPDLRPRSRDDETLAGLREELRRTPEAFIAQRTITLSCHPTTSDDGRLEPRHIDLRPFIFCGAGWTRALPGGLTRVALERGTPVVNSSQHGGGRDTWVLG